MGLDFVYTLQSYPGWNGHILLSAILLLIDI